VSLSGEKFVRDFNSSVDSKDIDQCCRGNQPDGAVPGHVITMNAAAPEGTPPRRIKTLFCKNVLTGKLEKPEQTLFGGSLHQVPPAPLGHPIAIIPPEYVTENFVTTGVKGCSPWAASPFGGERGSPSLLLMRSTELRGKNNDFLMPKICDKCHRSAVPGRDHESGRLTKKSSFSFSGIREKRLF
jgi:hypothetical protein